MPRYLHSAENQHITIHTYVSVNNWLLTLIITALLAGQRRRDRRLTSGRGDIIVRKGYARAHVQMNPTFDV